MPIITLSDILIYLGVGLRPLIEGDAVVNAEHIIMCGIYKMDPPIEVRALCQQTSNLKGPPHSIKIILTCTATTGKL